MDITLKAECNLTKHSFGKGKISNPTMTLICDGCEIRIQRFRNIVYILVSRQKARFGVITTSKPLSYNGFSRLR